MAYPIWLKQSGFIEEIKDRQMIKNFSELNLSRWSKSRWNIFEKELLLALMIDYLPDTDSQEIFDLWRHNYHSFLNGDVQSGVIFGELWSSYYKNSCDDVKDILLNLDLVSWAKSGSTRKFLRVIVNDHHFFESDSSEKFITGSYENLEFYNDLRNICTSPWYVNWHNQTIYFTVESGHEVDRTMFKLLHHGKWVEDI